MEQPKYQASLTSNGDMIVVRSDDKDEFKEMVSSALKLRKFLAGSAPKKAIGTVDKRKIHPDNCPGHEYYEATVKKEGPNKGRKFKACKNCNHFSWIPVPEPTWPEEKTPVQELSEDVDPKEIPF